MTALGTLLVDVSLPAANALPADVVGSQSFSFFVVSAPLLSPYAATRPVVRSSFSTPKATHSSQLAQSSSQP